MLKQYKKMSNEVFEQKIDILCKKILEFTKENEIRIDYICPILRSGVIPATYISNKLNIIKFLPIQVKHISYKNGDNKIQMIFNPFNAIEINKKNPVFLVVEAMHYTGTSAGICINEIRNR